jgi:hypothetical protein
VDMVKTVWFQLRQEQRKTLGNYDWIFVVKEIAGVIQVMSLSLFNVVIIFSVHSSIKFCAKYFSPLFLFCCCREAA